MAANYDMNKSISFNSIDQCYLCGRGTEQHGWVKVTDPAAHRDHMDRNPINRYANDIGDPIQPHSDCGVSFDFHRGLRVQDGRKRKCNLMMRIENVIKLVE